MDTRQDPFEYQMSLSDIQAIKNDTPPPAKPRVSAEKPTPKDVDPAVVKGNTTLMGQPADKVVINPPINPFLMEANEEPIVSPKNGKHAMIVGGFRPFTIAHHELVKHAQRNFEHVHVFTTESSKRPIPVEDNVGYIKKAVGSGVNVSSTKTPLHAAAEVYKRGAKNLTFVGGSDRKPIVDRLNQYNNKSSAHGEYHFTKPVGLEVFGKERKEGDTGLAGVSGTKARASKSPEELKAFIPKALHPHAAKIFKQINEDTVFEGILKAIGVSAKYVGSRVAKKLDQKVTNVAKQASGYDSLQRAGNKVARAVDVVARPVDYASAAIKQKVATSEPAQIIRRAKRIGYTVARPLQTAKAKVAGNLQKSGSVKAFQKIAKPIRTLGQHLSNINTAIKKVQEEVELEEAVSLRTRLSRARNMTMNKNKLARARQLARKRLAKTLQLRRRALKRARQSMRQRLAGDRGKNYKTLSTSDKIAIDRMADKRKTQIARMATRLAPRIKRDEISRLASIASGKRIANSATPMIAEQMNIKQLISEKAAIALANKAESSGVSLRVLCEVYARGIEQQKQTNHTPQQQGFARVNSFLAKGAAWEQDSDLQEDITRDDMLQMGIKTPRHMARFKFKNLKQVHSDKHTANIEKDISNDEDHVAQRKVADIIRRRTNQIKDKILENMASTNKRVATRLANQGKQVEAGLRSRIAQAAERGDATGVMHANMELQAKKKQIGTITTVRPKLSYGRGSAKTSYTSNTTRQRLDVSRKRKFNSALSEAVSSAITKTSNRLTRSTAPQINQVKQELIKAMKSKDYSSMADIIVYLTRDKLQQQKRIQFENVCVPEEDYIYGEWTQEEWETLVEENNEGKTLNKPIRTTGGPKKFAVYVKNDKGNIIKLGFGDPNLEIKRDDPSRRKAYRARHGCDNPGPKWKANWWSCNWSWSADKKVGA